MRFVTVSVTAAALALSAGCASTSTYLGADPGMHVAPIEQPLDVPIDPQLDGLIDIRSIDMHGRVTGEAAGGRALYLSVDITGVLARPNLALEAGPDLPERLRDRRDALLDVLLLVADVNAETWLARAFANRAFIEAGDAVLRDVLTGIGTGAATASPQVTAILGASSLVLSSSAQQINDSFYLNHTFQAMETVIRTERALARRAIRRKMHELPYDQYTLHDALADVRRYSELCSIRAGLAGLNRVAEQDRQLRLTGDGYAD